MIDPRRLVPARRRIDAPHLAPRLGARVPGQGLIQVARHVASMRHQSAPAVWRSTRVDRQVVERHRGRRRAAASSRWPATVPRRGGRSPGRTASAWMAHSDRRAWRGACIGYLWRWMRCTGGGWPETGLGRLRVSLPRCGRTGAAGCPLSAPYARSSPSITTGPEPVNSWHELRHRSPDPVKRPSGHHGQGRILVRPANLGTVLLRHATPSESRRRGQVRAQRSSATTAQPSYLATGMAPLSYLAAHGTPLPPGDCRADRHRRQSPCSPPCASCPPALVSWRAWRACGVHASSRRQT